MIPKRTTDRPDWTLFETSVSDSVASIAGWAEPRVRRRFHRMEATNVATRRCRFAPEAIVRVGDSVLLLVIPAQASQVPERRRSLVTPSTSEPRARQRDRLGGRARQRSQCRRGSP